MNRRQKRRRDERRTAHAAGRDDASTLTPSAVERRALRILGKRREVSLPPEFVVAQPEDMRRLEQSMRDAAAAFGRVAR